MKELLVFLGILIVTSAVVGAIWLGFFYMILYTTGGAA